MLAEREQSSEPMRDSIDRASELVKDGIADARQAVGALRGDELPGVARLASLIACHTSSSPGSFDPPGSSLTDPSRRNCSCWAA